MTSTPSIDSDPSLEEVFVFGAGGHGRAVAEVIRRQGRFRIVGVLDDARQPPEVLGAPWLGGREVLGSLFDRGVSRGFVAIGDNIQREEVAALVDDAGLELVNVIDPTAVVASDARLGIGIAIMPFSFCGANSSIGHGAIVNTSATVDHDCEVGAFAHISAGVHTTGGCLVGSRAFIGIGAVLGKPVSIGDDTVVGAGAAVIADLPPGVIAVGVPARVIGVAGASTPAHRNA